MSIFKKRSANNELPLRSKVIYNTEPKLIILLSYNSPMHLYDMIEFLSIAGRHHIYSYLSTDANEVENNKDEFVNKAIKYENNIYYTLICGNPANFAKVYNDLSLSNSILREITEDIYHYCDSAKFANLIEARVLDGSKFRYYNIKPKYDNFIPVEYERAREMVDVAHIINNIPDTFNVLDIAEMFTVYGSDDYTVWWPITHIIEIIFDYQKNNMNAGFFIGLFNRLKSIGVLDYIMPNATLESLAILTQPKYLREDLDEDDIEIGALTKGDVDEMFQKEYDRFIMPTAEYAGSYIDVDEVISKEPVEDED